MNEAPYKFCNSPHIRMQMLAWEILD